MSDRYVNMRNLQFLLDEVFEIQQLQALERYADYDPEAIKLTIDTARQLADQHLYPSYRA
ncbi:MAG: acyl-CoA dehydrogenase N-terminal domain-containing protein, partial [Saprospiraceae bacterium]|nr:acyl-CoA dehydrogenase N-terminal domain-containing protein [Saprospiraceae bacterium]MCB0683905.1 acyl-CoA dehydrogenase N-terminal domain-containing protein [Saprospiraceae bacterium]